MHDNITAKMTINRGKYALNILTKSLHVNRCMDDDDETNDDRIDYPGWTLEEFKAEAQKLKASILARMRHMRKRDEP